MRAMPCALALLAALALAPAAPASDPCGIYARVTKVELDPASPPQWVKVFGDFILVKTSGRLTGAERGYMYFGLNPQNPELCRLEWADLAKLAGKEGQNYIAFGSAHSRVQMSLGPNQSGPNVRKMSEPPGDPIPYPVNHGLTRLRTRDTGPEDAHNPPEHSDRPDNPNPVLVLQKFLRDHPTP